MPAIGIVLLLIACTPAAYATDIVVDPAGGAGAETSINAAIARAISGDSIVVHSGTYNETVYVNKWLTLTGIDTGGGQPLVDGGGHWGFEITASHALVQGFRVRNASCGILIDGIYDPSITEITARNNAVFDISGDAIVAEYSDGNHIIGNVISRSQQGVLLYSSNVNLIADNTIYDITASGIVASTDGNRITGNTLYGCRGDGIALGGRDNVVTGNTAHDNYAGIEIYPGSNIRVEGNIAYQNTDGLHLQDTVDSVISGNTVYGNARGLWLTTSRDNEVRDNVFRDNAEAIHSDNYLDQNTLFNNTIIGGPTQAASTPTRPPTPTSAAGIQPTAKPPTPRPAAGGISVGEISETLVRYGLIVGVAIIVLGIGAIGAIITFIIFVTWDEKRHKGR